jgi:hypothetical protein
MHATTACGIAICIGLGNPAALTAAPTDPAIAIVSKSAAHATHPVLNLTQSPHEGILDSASGRLPGAQYLRLHFKIGSGEVRPPLTLDVRDGLNQSVDLIDLAKLGPGHDIWSKVIPGEEYLVRVRGGSAQHLRIVIKDVTQNVAPVEVEGYAEGGPYWELVNDVHDDEGLRRAAQSVARLHVQEANGDAKSCTGFSIGGGRLITNQHCIATQVECDGTIVAFGTDDIPTPAEQERCTQLLSFDKALDLAVIATEATPPGVITATFSQKPLRSEDQLRIVQHGWNYPQRVSRQHCNVTAVGIMGRQSLSDVSYTCDTIQSSSGSPVFNANNEVVALHHLQFPNQGVLAQPILKSIDPFLPPGHTPPP